MKKLFLAVAILLFFAACNTAAVEPVVTPNDSTIVQVDSLAGSVVDTTAIDTVK